MVLRGALVLRFVLYQGLVRLSGSPLPPFPSTVPVALAVVDPPLASPLPPGVVALPRPPSFSFFRVLSRFLAPPRAPGPSLLSWLRGSLSALGVHAIPGLVYEGQNSTKMSGQWGGQAGYMHAWFCLPSPPRERGRLSLVLDVQVMADHR